MAKQKKQPKIEDAAPVLGGFMLNTHADVPDIRDRIYQPVLRDLRVHFGPPSLDNCPVLDQMSEGACTGFALAAAINLLNNERRQTAVGALPETVSPRMLYEMAKMHDEWPGETYEGSSIRGAIKGFFHNGVCRENLAVYHEKETGWSLTKTQAKDARNTGLGAYFRLRPEILDYHAALNEAGVIIVSAQIHRGWQSPKEGEIKQSTVDIGGHAFVIVGYDDKGFLIQNSWGEDWGGLNGRAGVVRWAYEDWATNIMDAWVLRLSVPTPDSFDLTHAVPMEAAAASFGKGGGKSPKRGEIIGHMIHVNDGVLVSDGKYATPLSTIEETAAVLIADSKREHPKYDHLMFYAHGGLNGLKASARRISKMKAVFKRNRIYPVHFMWETGLWETLGDVWRNAANGSDERVGGFSDFSDWMIEKLGRRGGRAVWRDMKKDAELAFHTGGGGYKALQALLAGNAARKKPLKVHLVGHSAGAIFLGELLSKMNKISTASTPVTSCSLMAPACTMDVFHKHYEPRIGKTGAADGLHEFVQYNLTEQREQDDTVGPYKKSLLYLVSRAAEESKKMPLLGMEKYSEDIPLKPAHTIYYAGRHKTNSDSQTHGGFDNDRATMNDVLKTILGQKPSAAQGFQPKELEGY